MTAMTYGHVLDRVLNRPLLMAPERLQGFLAGLGPRTGIAGVEMEGTVHGLRPPDLSRRKRADLIVLEEDEPASDDTAPQDRLYPVDRGVAVIKVEGTLVNRGAWVGAYSGLTSYEGLRRQMDMAAKDAAVKAILLDIDSGGGEAAGCPDMAARIAEIAKAKPVWAALGDSALSAAYWLASAAGVVTVPQLGEAGSIGCWRLHWDYSRQLDADGITPTLIHAGAKKVDGHPFQPLDEQGTAKADFQRDVDACRDLFAEAVARYRGVSLDTVLDTEAAILNAGDAVSLGLCDVVANRYEALDALARKVRENERTRRIGAT